MRESAGGLAGDLALATVRFARYLRTRTGESTVSLPQLSVLFALANDGPLTPGQLAARERVRPPTMTRVIAALGALGLVVRTAHPSDARQVVVQLSEAGERVIVGEAATRDEWLRQKLIDMTDEDRETLRRAVGILEAMLESDRGPAVRVGDVAHTMREVVE
ncbi:MarR family winged helix-turn-helix transcriptional regulator [Tsukamurella ocularis]|uniref:MarR family winged helix-turn-helix transcriptional regulator n=1 Tax=Tsukamurella ocularis TaxID=1970234 RepID=UPI0021685F71|nr:MarR family transcriptional regulator [Tsukamurella ocularis]MCS3779382.1 DNA-binding MarR family transcriptional regulator [Tsukamurella ocularis]MCS3789888.1 DNA-binding MarR family transcriptional regulator [Tsukamurella ocularis]